MDSYKSVDDENHEFKISAAARRFLRMKTKLADTHKNKKVIIISARVHPGEAVSSHIMRGFIDYVLGDTKEARTIRKHNQIALTPKRDIMGKQIRVENKHRISTKKT